MKENVLPMSKPQSFQYFQYDKSITEDEIKKNLKWRGIKPKRLILLLMDMLRV